MNEPFIELTATVNGENILKIQHKGETVSRKELTNTTHRGSFSLQGEKIYYIYERAAGMSNREQIYLYPINLNYAQNPIIIERS